jgi:multicomponent Na+:H+ antiporter subunit B
METKKWSGLIFIAGLTFFICSILMTLPLENLLSAIGMTILNVAPEHLGKPNIVSAVLYQYRGLDTLGELTVLFTAATATGLILSLGGETTNHPPQSGFILHTAADLLFPLLIIFGLYIILYGDFIPGGLFQGGAILAAAFFIPVLASPTSPINEKMPKIEGFAGAVFMVLGLLTLVSQGHFLINIFGETIGHFFWEGGLLLLHLAIALKVGIEIGGLLARFAEIEAES